MTDETAPGPDRIGRALSRLGPELRAAFAPPAGAPLARFEMTARLGEGATSVVWRARDKELGRDVAVKMLKEGLIVPEDVRERFRREARALARLKHPGIVEVFDVGAEGDKLFLVMELVDGAEPLNAWVKKNRPTPASLAMLFENIARALHHAHERGVVHRDLKPGNVLVGADGEMRIADFGLATVEREKPLTREGSLLGTALYMSPEQARGEKSRVSARTDVYAMGAMLFEALAGRTPHAGGSWMDVLDRVKSKAAPPLRSLAPSAPQGLAGIVDRALQFEPENRFASALEFAEALRLWRDDERFVPAPRPRRWLAPAIGAVAVAALAAGTILVRDRIEATGRQRAADAASETLRLRDEGRARASRLLEASRGSLERARAALAPGGAGPAEALRRAVEAEVPVREAAAAAPDLPLPQTRLGEIAELRGDFPRAVECFRRALELDASFGPARFRLGRILLWQSWVATTGYSSEVVRDPAGEARRLAQEGAAELESAGAESGGYDSDVQRDLAAAMLALLRGEAAEAAATCQRALETHAGREGIEDLLWCSALAAEDPAQRAASLDAALALRPFAPLALFARATIREASGDGAAALADIEAALAAAPDFEEAVLYRGCLRLNAGDVDGALADFDRLVAGARLAPEALIGRGRVRLDLQGDPAAALPEFDAALAKLPEGSTMAFYCRCRARFALADWKGSAADADRVIPTWDWAEIRYWRGRARLKLGDLRGAKEDLDAAVAFDPAETPERAELETGLK